MLTRLPLSPLAPSGVRLLSRIALSILFYQNTDRLFRRGTIAWLAKKGYQIVADNLPLYDLSNGAMAAGNRGQSQLCTWLSYQALLTPTYLVTKSVLMTKMLGW